MFRQDLVFKFHHRILFLLSVPQEPWTSVFSSARGSMRGSVNFGWCGGGGGGGATYIGTACHWLSRRGGEARRKILLIFHFFLAATAMNCSCGAS